MSTAVHGKTSLAEMLLADGAAPGKRGDDSHDKANTVDFGATLTSLIEQSVAGKAASGAKDVATSSTALSESKHGQKSSPTFDPSNAEVDDRFSGPAATPSIGVQSPESASPNEVAPHGNHAQSHSFAALLRQHKAVDEPDIPRDQATVVVDDLKATGSKDASTRAPDDKSAVEPARRPASTSIAAQSAVAATIDAPVPDPDIALDFRKQPFAAKPSNDASGVSDAQIAAPRNFAKVASSAPVEAQADIAAHVTPRANDVAHSHADRATDGTSPALSSPKSMNSADSKNSQTFATLAADSITPSTTTVASQTQMEAGAEIAPQDERTRTNPKDTQSQSADASSLANDSAHAAAAQPVARTAEAAAIRLNPEVSPRDPARTVSITVQLASGQTAQASVRERAGAVDVKILTPTAASAQRVSSELDGMRQNLDAAGIRLGHSEVSYQQGDGSGRQGREGYQPPAQDRAANGKEVFIMNEVVQ
jgi:hypothetical protein